MTRAEADQIVLALQLYIGHFGTDPPFYQFLHKPQGLVEEILAAVVRGEKLTDEDLHRRLGMQAPGAAR